MNRTFNIVSYGAIGDGVTNDWPAIQAALNMAASVNGCLYIPAGTYLLTKRLALTDCRSRVSIRGDGANVSILLAGPSCQGVINFSFAQDGQCQPWGVSIFDIGMRRKAAGGTAIVISYGNPDVTSDHCQPSTVLRGVDVVSDNQGAWDNGIRIEAAWNISFTDVFVSGDACGGNWNAMRGNGIELQRMCVNAHFANVRCNFWSNGFFYQSTGGNTEGMFFTNCSMVAVKQGVWIIGHPAGAAPRVSTLTWVGGMIEARVGGVLNGGSAAFHLHHVWTALITGCQMIAEALPNTHTTYGIFIDNSHGVVVSACDINAWHYGLFTVGECRGISSHGNTYTNAEVQNCFNPGTSGSRSYGHVCVNSNLGTTTERKLTKSDL